MKRKMKVFNVTLAFGTIALISIICNIVWIEYANLLLRLNPILEMLFGNRFDFMVDNGLQRQETGSFIEHYNEWAYCIHFVSYVLVGSIIDLVKNKFSFRKVWNI
ncbi:hypothetical protein MHB48_18310 [Psychrobacillus sp. FSL H8-0483]|uniref:hypothetical protein n=1 Tax=Psychrobacillus sp. FSL H8-0483 TaxID=2921389 RepID=UPI00315A8DDB